MRRTVIIWLGTALCAGVVAGCGGSSAEPAGTISGAGTVTPAVPSPAPAGGSSGGGSGAVAYTDAEACAWLAENLPKWEDITDEVSVQAQIAIGLASFFDDHGGLANADGYAYDEATSRGCAADHDAALKQAGITSFGAL